MHSCIWSGCNCWKSHCDAVSQWAAWVHFSLDMFVIWWCNLITLKLAVQSEEWYFTVMVKAVHVQLTTANRGSVGSRQNSCWAQRRSWLCTRVSLIDLYSFTVFSKIKKNNQMHDLWVNTRHQALCVEGLLFHLCQISRNMNVFVSDTALELQVLMWVHIL